MTTHYMLHLTSYDTFGLYQQIRPLLRPQNLEVLAQFMYLLQRDCRCVRPEGIYYSAARHEHHAASRKARNEQPARSASSLGRARQKETSKLRNLSAGRDLSGESVGMQTKPGELSTGPFSLRGSLLYHHPRVVNPISSREPSTRFAVHVASSKSGAPAGQSVTQ